MLSVALLTTSRKRRDLRVCCCFYCVFVAVDFCCSGGFSVGSKKFDSVSIHETAARSPPSLSLSLSAILFFILSLFITIVSLFFSCSFSHPPSPLSLCLTHTFRLFQALAFSLFCHIEVEHASLQKLCVLSSIANFVCVCVS